MPRLHVEKVRNHTIDDVAEIYDRHDYSVKMRAALSRLANCLEKIVSLKSCRLETTPALACANWCFSQGRTYPPPRPTGIGDLVALNDSGETGV
jgi:hypothetical protein